MTINGINGINTQMGDAGMNQAADSYSRNIQRQIANAQKQLQELSSNKDMSFEEKMKKRQEIQQQINDLNMQLRQHQMEQRREKQQAKGSSMDDMFGGNNNAKSKKSESKSTGLSQASMTAMISADSSMKQAKVQSSVASRFEERAGVLEIEIKLDESRAGSGLTVDTSDKKAELAEAEQKAANVTASQMKSLGEANKTLAEAGEAEEHSGSKDTETTSAKEKDEEKVSGADVRESASETNAAAETDLSAEQQTMAYASVDVRL